MVIFHALNRCGSLFVRRFGIPISDLFISLSTGPHQLHKPDGGISSNSSSSYPHFQKPHLLHSVACDSSECPPEQPEPEHSMDKPTRDSADVLREWGCTESEISKIFERRPSLRKTNTHILESKLQILSQLGIKSGDLVKMVHCRPRLLNCKLNVMLNERLESLRSLFGSQEVLTKAFIRNPSLLTCNFHDKIEPVVSIYESLGLTRQDLITMLLSRPTMIPRTTLDEEKIEYIRKIGIPRESKMYKHFVCLVGISRIETIREKVLNLEKYGLAEDEIFGLIRRSPLVLSLSVEKVQRHMTFVLGTMKLPAGVVLLNPFLLYFNLESILKPRFRIACTIDDMGLSPRVKGPLLLRALRMSEKRFVSAFIMCHQENVVQALMADYKNAKCVKRLAVSSKKVSSKGFPF